MKNIMILILLLTVSVSAEIRYEYPYKENEDQERNYFIKAKTNIEDGQGTSRLTLMLSELKWNYDDLIRVPSKNLSTITASLKDKPIIKVTFNPFMHTYKTRYIALYRFNLRFKDASDAQEIKYTLTNNNGESISNRYNIVRQGKSKTSSSDGNDMTDNLITLDEKAWKASSVDEAIRAVYGTAQIMKIGSSEISNQTNELGVPCRDDSRECNIDKTLPVSLYVGSEMNLSSIAVFSTMTQKPLVAFVEMPNNKNKIDFVNFPILLPKEGEIFFIVRDKHGKLYRSDPSFIRTTFWFHDDSGTVKMHFNLESIKEKR